MAEATTPLSDALEQARRRGVNLKTLTVRLGIQQSQLAAMEAGARRGVPWLRRAIADELGHEVSELFPPEGPDGRRA